MNNEKLERRFSDLLFIESAAPGICYATAENDNRIALIVDGRPVVVTMKQAHAIAKEIREVAAFYVGHGAIRDPRGRKQRA